MIEQILALDAQMFQVIHGFSYPVLDWLAAALAVAGSVYAWYLFIFILLVKKNKSAVYLLPAAVVNTLFVFLLKTAVARPRPFEALGFEPAVAAGAGSFPSGHAARAFLGATVLSRFYPKFSKWFFTFAALIALSRIYVGVHYPLDVLSGALIGLTVGLIFLSKPVSRQIKSLKKFFNSKA